MSQAIVSCPSRPLPRDLDVEVVISRPQTEIATDMTLMVYLSTEADFAPNNNRVRYYSTFSALAEDTTEGSALWWAGNAFFSARCDRSPWPWAGCSPSPSPPAWWPGISASPPYVP
ncbi:MAG: hypothetical protein LIP28_05315 [Deltaproteobacteria bacterium]|nr:hypothetical protein [Deltaproteobacteria bacterium]